MNKETEQKMLDCAKAATWSYWRVAGNGELFAFENDHDNFAPSFVGTMDVSEANANHIAQSSPQNVQALIESKRALEAALEALTAKDYQPHYAPLVDDERVGCVWLKDLRYARKVLKETK